VNVAVVVRFERRQRARGVARLTCPDTMKAGSRGSRPNEHRV